jgi:hypothetical protein
MRKISQDKLKELHGKSRVIKKKSEPKDGSPSPMISNEMIINAVREFVTGSVARQIESIAEPVDSIAEPVERNIKVPQAAKATELKREHHDGPATLKRSSERKIGSRISEIAIDRNPRGFIEGASGPDGRRIITINRDEGGYIRTISGDGYAFNVDRNGAGSITGISASN